MGNTALKESDHAALAIDSFERAVAEHLSGSMPAENFKAARVEMGVYAQRQKDFYMLRTRLPGGALSATAMEKYADLAGDLPTGTVHLTTRQDIQLHFVRIEQASALMRILAEAGISSAGAGGNTIRNITACTHPGRAGSASLAPLAASLNSYFTGHEHARGLPRKFKISFCGARGCYAGLTDDIAFVPTKNHGEENLAFDVYAGGGQGSAPRLGALLERGIPANEIHRVVLAALKVFNRHGTRKNRSRARIKFLIERIGFGEFERLYRAELAGLGDLAPFDINAVSFALADASDTGAEVLIKVPGGDLSIPQLRGLADVIRRDGKIAAQVTKNGDLLFSGVSGDGRGNLFKEIRKLGLEPFDHKDSHAVATCNGSVTCSEGITNSRGLSMRLEKIAAQAGGPALSIRVSGCPNACSGHHIADIGLQGSARRIDGALIPHYVISMGGTAKGRAKIAEPIGRAPARNVPAAVMALTGILASNANKGETAADLIERLGLELFEAEIKRFEDVGQDLAGHKTDFDTGGEFSLDEVGPGECAGSALDIIDGYFDQARRDLHAAEKEEGAGALSLARSAAILSAKALLVKYGVDPANDEETVREFRSIVVAKDENPLAWAGALDALRDPESEPDSPQIRLGLTKAFFDKCHEAYTLGSIPLAAEEEKKSPEQQTAHMDLTGVACPFNYTKIKLRLETLPVGARIQALLDNGSPIRNVPRSLENDGQSVLSITPSGNQFLLLLQKVI
ncbi:MAG: sulfurtransferase TusA family protein [Nitrospinota bacterium]|nr:sulfurtransferase TusA family protein [Nitrospinota bacterium]